MSSAKHPGQDWKRAISKRIKGAERLFVLGVGNPRKGDDGAGSLCARLLKRKIGQKGRSAPAGDFRSGCPGGKAGKLHPFEVQVLDAGESPENATGLIREFRPTHVLIVDAALGGFEAGTIFIINRKKIAQEEISTHRIPLVHLVRYLEESIGCRVILVGIKPQEIAWGKPVSPAVKAGVARLAAWLAKL
jgi:hydrogenase 3 maturation protease